MIQQKVRWGTITYWTASEYTKLDSLRSGLEDLGLGQFCPEPRTPQAALRDALQETFPGKDFSVEKLEDQGFEVVRIERGELRNSYHHLLTAKLNEDHTTILFQPLTQQAQDVVASYNKHLGQVKVSAVTGCLTAILAHLGGTRLRPGGGIYWLADDRLPLWERVGQATEGAAVGGRTTVYRIRHDLDRDSVKAVHDAIAGEVRAEAEKLGADLQSGTLGERGLKNRQLQATALRDKIREYEQILGLSLESLHRAVDDAECAEALATISIAAGLGEETCSA